MSTASVAPRLSPPLARHRRWSSRVTKPGCSFRPRASAADLADALIDRDNAAEALRALASLAPLTDALRHKPKCDVAVRLLAARVVAETETTPLPAHVATAMDWAFGRVLF